MYKKLNNVVFITIILTTLIFTGCAKSTNDNVNYTINTITGLTPVTILSDSRLIVLIDNQNSENNSIYVTNIDGSNKIKIIDSTPSKKIYSVINSDNWVIYAEASNTPVKDDWAISAINLIDKRKISIDNSQLKESDLHLQTSTLIAPMLSTSGSKITWSTYEPIPLKNGQYQVVVRLFDVNTMKSKIIDSCDTSEDFGHPKIDNNYLVYDKGKIDANAAGRWGTIYVRNLNDNSSTVLDSGLNIGGPDIKFPYIIWNSGRENIILYDMKTEKRKVITTGLPERWSASINDKIITWFEATESVSFYKLPNGPAITVKNSNVTGGGKVIGNFFFWSLRKDNPVTYEWIDTKKI